MIFNSILDLLNINTLLDLN